MNKSSIDVDVARVLLLRLQLCLGWSDLVGPRSKIVRLFLPLVWFSRRVNSNVQQSECLISTWICDRPCAPVDIEPRCLRWSWAGRDRDVLVDGGSSSEVMGWLKTKVGDTTLDCDLCQYVSLACCTCYKCVWSRLLFSSCLYFSFSLKIHQRQSWKQWRR